jgi:hypothetical protein
VASSYTDYAVHKGTLNLPKIRYPEHRTMKFETVVITLSEREDSVVEVRYLDSAVIQPVLVDSRYVSRN